jgi:hypothetical protein
VRFCSLGKLIGPVGAVVAPQLGDEGLEEGDELGRKVGLGASAGFRRDGSVRKHVTAARRIPPSEMLTCRAPAASKRAINGSHIGGAPDEVAVRDR